jgi:osmotically-inducible protein OsmY
MKRLISIGLGALLVAACTPGVVFAQAAGYSGGGGGGMGGGGGGGGSFGSSGTAFGSSGSMFSSSGSTFSSSTGSGSPFGSNSAFGGTGTTGTGTSGMVGMTAGGMYGAAGAGVPNAAGRTGSNYSSSSQYGNRGGQNGQYGGGQGRQGGGSRRGSSTQGQSQVQPGGAGAAGSPQAYFEPRIEVGFSVPNPQATAVQTDIAAPMRAPSLSPRFGTVKVSVQGSVVTLRGTVNSDDDRLLAAQMAMLEPAVSAVQNELIVAPPAAHPPR